MKKILNSSETQIEYVLPYHALDDWIIYIFVRKENKKRFLSTIFLNQHHIYAENNEIVFCTFINFFISYMSFHRFSFSLHRHAVFPLTIVSEKFEMIKHKIERISGIQQNIY